MVSALVVLALTALYLRLGVSFTDEPFNIAMPLRFALGDRPFVDELNLVQTVGVYLEPVARAFLWLRGGTDGIVLYWRALHLLLGLLVGSAVFVVLRRFFTWPVVLLAALLPAFYVPWGMATLSYVTIGYLFLTLALYAALGSTFLSGRQAVLALGASGCALGISVAAYPTMVLPAVALMVALVWHTRSRGLSLVSSIVPYVLGGVLGLLPGLWTWAIAGIPNLTRSLHLATSLGSQASGAAKLVTIGEQIFSVVVRAPFFLVPLVALAFGRSLTKSTRGKAVMLASIVLLPLTLWGLKAPEWTVRASLMLVFWGIGALLLSYSYGPRSEMRVLRLFVIFPSIVAAFAFAYSSNSGFFSAGSGMLPAAIAMIVLSGQLTSDLVGDLFPRRVFPNLAGLAVVLLFLGVLGLSQWASTLDSFQQVGFRSSPFVAVHGGPWNGLLASPESAALAARLQRDYDNLARPGDGVLFADCFTAGYLLSARRPVTAGVYMLSPVQVPQWLPVTEEIPRYYERTGKRPTLVFLMNYLGQTYPEWHPIARFLAEENYRVVFRNGDYVVYRLGP